MNRLLWVVQVLLALLFLFAGGEKQIGRGTKRRYPPLSSKIGTCTNSGC